MGRGSWGGAVVRPLLGTIGLLLPTTAALAWDDWWHHDDEDDVCYLRDDGDEDRHDLGDLFDGWCHDGDDEDRIEVPCEYFCDGGCVQDAAWWCAELSGGGSWPIPEWETGMRCGESWLDLICSTATDRFHALAREYATAILNYSDGACLPDPVMDDLWEAHDLLRGCSITADEREDANWLIVVLKSYNGGRIGPGTCQETPVCDWSEWETWLDEDCWDQLH